MSIITKPKSFRIEHIQKDDGKWCTKATLVIGIEEIEISHENENEQRAVIKTMCEVREMVVKSKEQLGRLRRLIRRGIDVDYILSQLTSEIACLRLPEEQRENLRFPRSGLKDD